MRLSVSRSKLSIYLPALLLSVVCTWASGGSQTADAQPTPFYQGKTIQIIAGSTAGSLYDVGPIF